MDEMEHERAGSLGRRFLLRGALGSFALAMAEILASRAAGAATAGSGNGAGVGGGGGVGGAGNGGRDGGSRHHRRRRREKRRQRDRPRGAADQDATVTLYVGNETNADFDLEGFSKDGKRCRNIVEEPVEPGATATIAFAKIPGAVAWINDHYGVFVEVAQRGKGRNGSAEIGHGVDGVANCRAPDEIDAENHSMSVGKTLEATIDGYRFVLTREENRKSGWLVFRVNVQDAS